MCQRKAKKKKTGWHYFLRNSFPGPLKKRQNSREQIYAIQLNFFLIGHADRLLSYYYYLYLFQCSVIIIIMNIRYTYHYGLCAGAEIDENTEKRQVLKPLQARQFSSQANRIKIGGELGTLKLQEFLYSLAVSQEKLCSGFSFSLLSFRNCLGCTPFSIYLPRQFSFQE